MKYKLKEVNQNQTLMYMKNLIISQYAAKFAALRSKYCDLRVQLFKELREVEQQYNDEIRKSIESNKPKY